jgi:hypothetical protein
MTRSAFTFTAELAVTIPIGPEQMHQVALAGSTVEVYHNVELLDPAKGLVTVRQGDCTGVACVADLFEITAKAV